MCSQVSYSIILDSVCHMLYLCKVLWVMELVCDVCSLGGVGCEFWRHSLFTLCHYALYCIADCSSCRFLSTLGMVRMFPVGCRCVVVYPDTQIHTNTHRHPTGKIRTIPKVDKNPHGEDFSRWVPVCNGVSRYTNTHRHPAGKILTIPKVDKNPRELQSAIQDSA